MGPGKQLVNAHFPRRTPCLLLIGVSIWCVRKAYQGRKRGEVVRTRTVVLQAHTHQFLGTFGGQGLGDYRSELRRAIQVITSYATELTFPLASVLVRLDGLYGDAAPHLDILTAGLGMIARSRAYHLLDLEVVKQVLARAPAHISIHPESGMTRTLYDCPAVPLIPAGPDVRMLVATHPATSSSLAVGVERDGTALTNCLSVPCPSQPSPPQMSLICICIAAHLRPCEPPKMPNRTPTAGTLIPAFRQEFAQILAQWVWNLRLELGQQLSPTELRTTEFAPAREAETPSTDDPEPAEGRTPAVAYGPPQRARPSFTHGFPGSAFLPQPDGTDAVPCEPPALSEGPASRTRWLLADLVCCAHRPLPLVSVACPMSRKQHHAETTTGERSVVAALHISLGFLASS